MNLRYLNDFYELEAASKSFFFFHNGPLTDNINSWNREKVYCEEGVILASGAINTPQLLLLSGIGPADNIKVSFSVHKKASAEISFCKCFPSGSLKLLVYNEIPNRLIRFQWFSIYQALATTCRIILRSTYNRFFSLRFPSFFRCQFSKIFSINEK